MANQDSSDSLDERFQRVLASAVNDAGDDQAYWQGIFELQVADPAALWLKLEPLASSEDSRLRELVPDVVRVWGHRAKDLLPRIVSAFSAMLQSEDQARVIAAIGAACGELAHAPASDLLVSFARHPDAAVRLSVAVALQWTVTPDSVTALIMLTADENEDVRNWATFAFSSREPDEPEFVDIEEVREALARRLEDPYEEVRAEAVLALAKRRDERAIRLIREELVRGVAWSQYIEAAIYLPQREFFPALDALARSGRYPEQWEGFLDAAIVACSEAVD